jgi:hypothetical protein
MGERQCRYGQDAVDHDNYDNDETPGVDPLHVIKDLPANFDMGDGFAIQNRLGIPADVLEIWAHIDIRKPPKPSPPKRPRGRPRKYPKNP